MSNPTNKPPMTAAQINSRMTEIGELLASYRIGYHPNAKALMAELDHLRAIYDTTLKSESVKP